MTDTPSDDAGGRFTIDGGSGVVTVAGADRLDYDTATSHTIEVAATSTSTFTDGSTSSQTYTVNLSEVTEGLATLNVDIEMTVDV